MTLKQPIHLGPESSPRKSGAETAPAEVEAVTYRFEQKNRLELWGGWVVFWK